MVVSVTTANSLGNTGESYFSIVPATQFSTQQDHYHLQINEGISNDQCGYTNAVATTAARGGIFNEGTCIETTKSLFSYVHLNMPLASAFEQTLKSYIYIT